MQNPRFEVRESTEGLMELDAALLQAGYVTATGKPDRAGWYREQKRKLIIETKKEPK